MPSNDNVGRVSSPPFGPTSSAAASAEQQAFAPSLNLPPFSNGTALADPGDPVSSTSVDWNSLFAAFPTPLADPSSWQEAANHDTCTHSHGVDPFSFDPQLAFALPGVSTATPLSLHADPGTFRSTVPDDVMVGGFPTNMMGNGTLASRPSFAGSSASPSTGGTHSTPCLSNSTVTTPATSLLSGRDAARLTLSKLSSQFSLIQRQLYPGPSPQSSDPEGTPLPHAVPKLASVAETISTVSQLIKYECEDFGDDFEGAEVHDPSRTEPAAAAQWKRSVPSVARPDSSRLPTSRDRFLSPHAAFLGFSAVMQLYTCLSAYLSAPLDHVSLLEELRPIAPMLLDAEKESVRKVLVGSHLRGLDKVVDRWDEMARQRHHDDGCVCVVQTMVVSFRGMSDALKRRHGL